jgi:ubiquinol-cytochrome c reductase cytochrome b subunit
MSLWGELLPKIVTLNKVYQFFIVTKIKSTSRIGPHNKDVLDIFFGSLLGDAFAEFRQKSTRICFQQEISNVYYLKWLHKKLGRHGYCNPKTPKILKRTNGEKTRYYLKFKTFSFQSLNWIHELFYYNGKKLIPTNKFLLDYLTPLALAIWIMDDGTKTGSGLSLATNCFFEGDLTRIQKILLAKYNLKTSLHKTGVKNQFRIYIWSNSMPILRQLVKPYLAEAKMTHKLG